MFLGSELVFGRRAQRLCVSGENLDYEDLQEGGHLDGATRWSVHFLIYIFEDICTLLCQKEMKKRFGSLLAAANFFN